MRAFIVALALVALLVGCQAKPKVRPHAPDNTTDISAPVTINNSYTVQPGDTLPIIAKREYGDETRWKNIYYANYGRLRTPEDLKPGMKILLPPKDQPAYKDYVVKKGDTLSSIALEVYGDKAKARFIAEENKLANPNSIRPNQVLRLPNLK
jgi:nucleoid-associated protein YgaU